MRLRPTIAGLGAAAVLLSVGVAGPAGADPIDLADSPGFVVGNTVWDLYNEAPVTVRNVWVYEEGTDPTAADAEDHLLNYGHNDMWWSAFIGDSDTTYYSPGLVWDEAEQANGDIVVTGPVEQISGLDVTGEFRFYAAGDLVRMLATYTNGTDEPITVRTGTDSSFAQGPGATVATTSSGDTLLTVTDRWLVGHDGGVGAPILTMVWQGPTAPLSPDEVTGGIDEGSLRLETGQDVTVEPGETVRFAYFTAVTGYAVGLEPPVDPSPAPVEPGQGGLEETVVAADVPAAVAVATSATAEFASFSGRLVAGLPIGTEVLNWGTVAAAAPAVPVITPPAFTG